MTSVGVRELRQRASDLLRLVEAGETVEITDRGRPVAVLAPLPDVDGLEMLRALGDVDGSSLDIVELPAPLVVDAAGPTPSQVLAELRRDER